MKICLIKTSSLGDILHALPALTDAKHALPHLQVDWVVEENFSEIPQWHPAVNQIIPIALRRWRKNLCKKSTFQQWQHYKKQLQSTHYDAVIDAQGLLKSALFATRLAQGKSYGYNKNSIREPLASYFYQRTYEIPYQQHAVERIRQLFAQSLHYTLPNTLGNFGIASYFSQHTLSLPITINRPFFLFFHATTRADKHWQNHKWYDLALSLIQTGYDIYLPWGNEAEKQQAYCIANHHPHIHILPKLTLSQLATLINQAQGIISVDTGLSHLAAALHKNNITLYGPTNPDLICGYGENQTIVKKDTMAHIEVADILTHLASKNCQPCSHLV